METDSTELAPVAGAHHGPGSAGLPRSIGSRLRNVRRSLGLTLHDVQARTGGEFKASALGAYERAERSVSIKRLSRLADAYGVEPSTFLADETVIDLPELHAEDGRPVSADKEFALGALARFAAYVRVRRSEPSSAAVAIRATDLEILAVLLGRDAGDLEDLLSRLGMRSPERADALTPARR